MANESTDPPGKGFTVVDRRGAEPAEASDASVQPNLSAGATNDDSSFAAIDFATFVMSLGSSALYHLGELSAPGEPTPPPDLPLAKQTIDILGMIEQKTRGNLTADEANLLEHLLFDLRLKYVEVKKGGAP